MVRKIDLFQAFYKRAKCVAAVRNFHPAVGMLEKLRAVKIENEDVLLPYKWPKP